MNDIAVKTAFYWMRESFLALKEYPNGIKKWQEIMDKALTTGYEKMGATRLSGPKGFLEYVVERDRLLGLRAGGSIINENKFSYHIKDPFIDLKDTITKEEYEQISTYGYLKTKMNYFLGPDWKAAMQSCPWNNDKKETLWVIEK